MSGDSRGGSATTKRKVTLYFNSIMLAETQHEAIRQDRSISWIIQAAWRRARDEIKKLPSAARTDPGALAQPSDQNAAPADPESEE